MSTSMMVWRKPTESELTMLSMREGKKDGKSVKKLDATLRAVHRAFTQVATAEDGKLVISRSGEVRDVVALADTIGKGYYETMRAWLRINDPDASNNKLAEDARVALDGHWETAGKAVAHGKLDKVMDTHRLDKLVKSASGAWKAVFKPKLSTKDESIMAENADLKSENANLRAALEAAQRRLAGNDKPDHVPEIAEALEKDSAAKEAGKQADAEQAAINAAETAKAIENAPAVEKTEADMLTEISNAAGNPAPTPE